MLTHALPAPTKVYRTTNQQIAPTSNILQMTPNTTCVQIFNYTTYETMLCLVRMTESKFRNTKHLNMGHFSDSVNTQLQRFQSGYMANSHFLNGSHSLVTVTIGWSVVPPTGIFVDV